MAEDRVPIGPVKRQVAEARDNQRKKHEALKLTMEKNMRLTRLQTCVRVMSTMVLHVLRRKLVLRQQKLANITLQMSISRGCCPPKTQLKKKVLKLKVILKP
jgi:hypothetical protein